MPLEHPRACGASGVQGCWGSRRCGRVLGGRCLCGLSVGVAMDVFHAFVAVVAQGSIVVVGEESNQLIGAVLGRGNEPQGRAPALALPKYHCLACRSATTAASVLARADRSCCRREADAVASQEWCKRLGAQALG